MTSLNRLFPAFPLMLGLNVLPAYADEDPANSANPTESVGAVRTVVYICESGNEVIVRYDNTSADTPTAQLTYRDEIFDLYHVWSQSGAWFATEQGLAPDKGLQWWTNGGKATLSEMLMDHMAPDPTQIESCKAQNPQASD